MTVGVIMGMFGMGVAIGRVIAIDIGIGAQVLKNLGSAKARDECSDQGKKYN
jgi:hypothetical protein